MLSEHTQDLPNQNERVARDRKEDIRKKEIRLWGHFGVLSQKEANLYVLPAYSVFYFASSQLGLFFIRLF